MTVDLAALVTPPPMPAAQRDYLATMPADVRIYEEFRYWNSFQRPEIQSAPLGHYDAVLSAQGVAPADRAERLRLIRDDARRLEIDRWTRVLTAPRPYFNTDPNAFLVEMVRGRRPGRALDVAMGQGRNALYLAEQGWHVTGFDLSEPAVAAAQAEAARRNLTLTVEIAASEEFDWGTARWDMIVLSYVTVRPYVRQIVNALAPGGLIVLEAYHRDPAQTASIGGGVVYEPKELLQLFDGLRVLRYEDVEAQADFAPRGIVTRAARLAAEKI